MGGWVGGWVEEEGTKHIASVDGRKGALGGWVGGWVGMRLRSFFLCLFVWIYIFLPSFLLYLLLLYLLFLLLLYPSSNPPNTGFLFSFTASSPSL